MPIPRMAGMVGSMRAKAQTILEQFEALPRDEQRGLCGELERRLVEKPAVELYGEPLTDEDIAESAHVSFAALGD